MQPVKVGWHKAGLLKTPCAPIGKQLGAALLRKVLPLSFFNESKLGIHLEQARAISDTEDSRHKSIEKNNFFLFTKKIQILDAVNKIHNLFPLESAFHQLFFLSVTKPIVKTFQKSNPRSSLLQQDALQKATVVRKSEGKQICTLLQTAGACSALAKLS